VGTGMEQWGQQTIVHWLHLNKERDKKLNSAVGSLRATAIPVHNRVKLRNKYRK
jgi:hypothetical protein